MQKALLKNSIIILLLLDQNWQKKVPNTGKTFQDFLTSHNENMQFEELNFDELDKAFKSLKQNKTANFNELSTNIITDAYDSLRNILFHVFKVSI